MYIMAAIYYIYICILWRRRCRSRLERSLGLGLGWLPTYVLTGTSLGTEPAETAKLPTLGSGLFFLSFGEKKASWIPEESRRSKSTAGRTRRETRAQKCAASAQTLPDVGAAASVSISNISPAVAGLVVSVFSRASPMCVSFQPCISHLSLSGLLTV